MLNNERAKAAKREKEAVAKATEEATKETEDKGILIAIASLRKHKISDTDILQDLMDNYHLDRSAAEKYMAMPANDGSK